MFRHAWRLHSHPNILVSRIFNAKYKQDWLSRSLNNQKRNQASWAARGIFKTTYDMRNALKRRIGNDTTAEESLLIILHKVMMKIPGFGVETMPKGTLKNGYWFLRSPNTTIQKSKFWRNIWKQQMWPKWKLFLWKLLNNALPTGLNMIKRNLQVKGTCVFGCEEIESTDNFIQRLHHGCYSYLESFFSGNSGSTSLTNHLQIGLKIS